MSFKTFFNKTTRKGKKYYLLPKTGNFCGILKKSVVVRVSKSAKYCLNHKGFHPIILLSKVGCFLLPSVYVAFSDILMPEELPQILSFPLVVDFNGAEQGAHYESTYNVNYKGEVGLQYLGFREKNSFYCPVSDKGSENCH